MTKRLVQLLCLLLCFLLLPLPARAASAKEAAPNVRVLLRRLELTDRADLVLDGEYTAAVDGEVRMAFPRGSKASILIREGSLYLFYEGMSMRLGDEVTFIRNESSASRNGLRFDKNGTLYPGHLSLKIVDGQLYPVCGCLFSCL